MPKPRVTSADVPLCGADLELWRLENALTKTQAAEAFGLRKVKWDELVSAEMAQEPLGDPAVAMLLNLYRSHPESSPVTVPPDVADFFAFLGMSQQSQQDRELFAVLIGRSKPSVHRLLIERGTPSRQVVRWIEAVRRMRLTPKQTRLLMTDVATSVGNQQGVENVLSRGWSRAGPTESEVD